MLLLIASIIIGLSIGLLLSKIAFEELEESKKYILLLKRIILLGVVFLSSYSLFLNFNMILLIVVLGLLVTFIFEIKIKKIRLEFVYYLLFSTGYFVINDNLQKEIVYILISLILLYGVPLSSLIHLHFIGEGKENKRDIKKIKKSHNNKK